MNHRHADHISTALEPVLDGLQQIASAPVIDVDSSSRAIFEEIKILTATIESLSTLNTNTDGPSIAVELDAVNSNSSSSSATPSGWRFIGTKKVWKPDWSNYDAKQRARRLQDKQIAKARKRRQRNKRNKNNGNCNINNNNRNTHHHVNDHNNNASSNQNNINNRIHLNNHNNNNNSYNNNNNNCNNNNNNNSNNNNNFNNNFNNNNKINNNNRNNNNNNYNNTNKTTFNPAPTDKELLNLAKSGRVWSEPALIKFNRGEVLNPSGNICNTPPELQNWPLPPRSQDLETIGNIQIRPGGLFNNSPSEQCCRCPQHF